MRFWNKYARGTSSHSDELTGDFGNKPEAILIGDHGLSCLLAEKLSLRDLRLLQQYLPLADSASAFRFKKPAAPRKAALRIWCRHLSKTPGGGAGDGWAQVATLS